MALWFTARRARIISVACSIEGSYLLNPPLGRKTLSYQWLMKSMQYVYRSDNIRWNSTSHWLCHALLGCRSRVEYSPEGQYLFSSGERSNFFSLYQCDRPTGVG